MRRVLGIISLAAAAVAVAGTSGNSLAGFASAINGAKSLSANYTVTPVGGAADTYTVVVKKPNMARIETPLQLIVADGKTLTTFDKGAKTYFKKPQTDEELAGLFASDELNVWAGFFKLDAYKPVRTRDLGVRNRKGMNLSGVEAAYDAAGKKTVTYFLNQQDKVVRQAQIDLNDPSGKTTFILDTKSLTLDTNPGDATFTFDAPSDAREVSVDEMNAAKWYTDLNEAKRVAAASGKKLFVDFMAEWCGPCKLLERDVLRTERFKSLSKKLVFVKIDVDAQPGVAKAYGIEAMPTQMVLASDGSVVSKTVGYGGAHPFYSWLLGAIGR
jgi:thiol-disulfide isomerase/thioredoxin